MSEILFHNQQETIVSVCHLLISIQSSYRLYGYYLAHWTFQGPLILSSDSFQEDTYQSNNCNI